MSSIQSQIVDFIVGSSCLAYTTGRPSGLAVGRGTTLAAVAEGEPRIDVYVGAERTQSVGPQGGGYPMLRTCTLVLECRVNGGSSPDLALDPLKVWAEQRLYADETFGGLGAGIIGWSTEQDARQSDKTYAMATLAVEIQYVTVRGDPSTRPTSGQD